VIIGIMQPYFFPYIGYFQLISHCNVFVFHDDVRYIKGGWINRNRIVNNDGPFWITLPVLRAPHEFLINERYYSTDSESRNRLLRRIAAAYRTAPRFSDIYPLAEEIMGFAETNVAAFNIQLIRRIAAHLKIKTPCVVSSQLPKNNSLAGQERVIEICRVLSATHYVNLIGGRELYDSDVFSRAGLKLGFLKPAVLCSAAANDSAMPLSILDDLMHTEEETLTNALKNYKIVS
jgi:WbqC-like protein family